MSGHVQRIRTISPRIWWHERYGYNTIFIIRRNTTYTEGSYSNICQNSGGLSTTKDRSESNTYYSWRKPIDYPFELTTRTADLTTTKILWNSVISTPGAKYCAADVKNFYLCTPMDRHEYMRFPINIIPQEFIHTYNLMPMVKNGYVYAACTDFLKPED